MKYIILILALFLSGQAIAQSDTTQTASVEKSLFGIQLSLFQRSTFGIYGYGEFKLSNEMVIRSELGIDGTHEIISNLRQSKYLTTAGLLIGPRWYYNLENRLEKSKSIKNNSGNFIDLYLSYRPEWASKTKSRKGAKTIPPLLAVTTEWGIRRNLGKHFNYEAGLGAVWITGEPFKILEGIGPSIHLRFGFKL